MQRCLDDTGGVYLTPQEVAERLRVDVKVIYRRIRSGDLPADDFGTESRPLYRIKEENLEAWVARRRSASG